MTPDWAAALERAARAPVTLLVGESDAGKTTLVTRLANALVAGRLRVGIVDADLGQSEIGPPTTVGLGRARAALARPADAELVALHFVGVTSPAANPLGAVVGTTLMVQRARAHGLERILIDTSGLVAGDLGRAVKQAKIDLVDPDLVIALQRGRECEHIVRPYEAARRPEVLRLPALGTPASRTPADRRRLRTAALEAWFRGARLVALDLGRVVLRTPALFIGDPVAAGELRAAGEAIGHRLLWAERRDRAVTVVCRERLDDAAAAALARVLGGPVGRVALADLVPALAGLESAEREMLGIGVVRDVDFGGRVLSVHTAVPPGAVATVTVGREKYGQ